MAKKSDGDNRSQANQQIMHDLYEPFTEDKIKVRQGRAGQKWKFVEAAEMINRLNKVFGVRWSSEEIATEFNPPSSPTHIVKRVRVTVPDPDDPSKTWHREGHGSNPLFDSKGNPYDPGDCHKSAESKAFVKAASKLGVALHLWGVSGEEDNVPDDVIPPWQGNDQFAQPVDNMGNYTGGQPPQQYSNQQQYIAPPQMSNPVASNPSAPPQPQFPPQNNAPFPQMGNPNVGMTSGPGTQAVAQVPIQVQAQAPSQGGAPVQEFQLSAIRGASIRVGMQDPMQLVAQALGAEVNGIATVEMLSFDQALRVLDYIRSIQNNQF